MPCAETSKINAMNPSTKPPTIAMLVLELTKHFAVVLSFRYSLPKDSEVLVNHSTYFNCSTSDTSKEIFWYHYHIGAEVHERNPVYAHGNLYEPYNADFEVCKNTSVGTSSLVIRSAKLEYAGTYVCYTTGSQWYTMSAQLIILDTTPTCASSSNQNGIIGPNNCGIEPEELRLSCSVAYHGNVPPRLQWRENTGNYPVNGNDTEEIYGGRVTTNITIKSDLNMDGSSYVCQTTRSTATQYSCNSDVVKILYIMNASHVRERFINDEVNCSANSSSESCQYKWLWFNDTDFLTESNNQTLKIRKIGQHRCEATCNIRNTECMVIASWLNASKILVGSEATDFENVSSKVVLAALLGGVFLCLVIGLTIYVLRIRRMQCRESEGRTEERVVETISFTVASLESQALHEGEADITPDSAEVEQSRASFMEDEPHESCALLQESVHYNVSAKIRCTMNFKDTENAIVGLTMQNNELFVAFEQSSEVQVYHANVLLPMRSFMMDRLISPVDITSSPKDNCLYISSRDQIFRVDENGKIIVAWPIEKGGGTLSVSDDRTVILSVWRRGILTEYSINGELIREVRLPSGVHLFHAVKTKYDHFVVSCEFHMMQNVCKVDVNGSFILSFGGMLNFPKYLTVNSGGYIFVVDQQNSRVLLLSPTLECLRVLISAKDGLGRPSRIYLDEPNSQIFVADVRGDDIKVIVFELQKQKLSGDISDRHIQSSIEPFL